MNSTLFLKMCVSSNITVVKFQMHSLLYETKLLNLSLTISETFHQKVFFIKIKFYTEGASYKKYHSAQHHITTCIPGVCILKYFLCH